MFSSRRLQKQAKLYQNRSGFPEDMTENISVRSFRFTVYIEKITGSHALLDTFHLLMT